MQSDDFPIVSERLRPVERLGEGTVGTTWLVKDGLREQEIIIKVIHEDLIEELDGLIPAAQSLKSVAGFRNANVLNVYDYAIEENHLIVSMEAARGTTLKHRIEDAKRPGGNPIRESEIASVIQSVTEVLVEGEKSGLCHGGLKPENIWMDPQGRVLMSEFGINRIVPPEKVKTTAALKGARQYLPPEMYDSTLELSAKADQYALGRIWLEMLRASNLQEGDPTWRKASVVINRLVSVDPDERYPSGADLMTAAFAALDSKSLLPTGFEGWRIRTSPSPVTLALISVAIITLLLFDLIGSRSNKASSPPIWTDEASFLHDMNVLERERMQLILEAREFTELDPMLSEAFGSVHEFDMIREFFTTPMSGQNTDSAIKRALESRRDEIGVARKALENLKEIGRFQKALEDFELQDYEAYARFYARMSGVQKECVELMQRRLFHEAHDKVAAVVTEGRTIEERMTQMSVQEYREAQAKYANALEKEGIPYAEVGSLHDPSAQRDSKIDWPARIFDATRKAIASVAKFQEWTSQVENLPDIKAGTFVNSLGMRLVPTGPFRTSVFETRVIDFFHFVDQGGYDANRFWREDGSAQGPVHAVAHLARTDANRFCEWLTKRDLKLGLIGPHEIYRLPTDEEWSRLAGIEKEKGVWPYQRHHEATDIYPWKGRAKDFSRYGNYYTTRSVESRHRPDGPRDIYVGVSPVGRFLPNNFGLYDLGGNVLELVSSPYTAEVEEVLWSSYTLRGGSWRTVDPEQMRSGFRLSVVMPQRDHGFRCVLALKSSAQEESSM